ncbi:hypothetical protein [Aquilutibacter rugosus]|uniref:hypothetical protein n=1 Tax=Aquilutibacter rugosus TaxID=3115820 RepID=UPI002F3FDC04
MNLNWYWPNQGATATNTIADYETFDTDKHELIETLTRESIQNSLDARLNNDIPVRIQFSEFYRDAVADFDTNPFLAELLRLKVDSGQHLRDEHINGGWILVEDSNTTGLKGDLTSRTSDFWNYWMNFGLSNKGKDSKSRGGRGIGRMTLPLSSGIRTVVGVTKRHEDGVIAACGFSFMPPAGGDRLKSFAALLGNDPRHPDDDICQIHSREDIVQFTEVFGTVDYFSDDAGSGFSLIIPSPLKRLNLDRCVTTAIQDFAPAILSNELIVTVNGVEIDSETIWTLATEKKYFDYPFPVEMIRQVLDEATESIVASDTKSQKEAIEFFDRSDIDRLIEKFEHSGQLRFDIMLRVKKEVPGRASEEARHPISIFLRRNPEGQCDSFFYRSGMRLPEMTSFSAGGTEMVLLLPDSPLAHLASLCEGRAHLKLEMNEQIESELEQAGFSSGRKIRVILSKLFRSLPQIFSPNREFELSDALAAFFPRVSSAGSDSKSKPVAPSVPPIKASRDLVRVSSLRDGFEVRATDGAGNIGTVKCSAWFAGGRRSSWSPNDFEFEKMNVVFSGTEAPVYEKNTIILRGCIRDFYIRVTGFDELRDLEVSVLVEEGSY